MTLLIYILLLFHQRPVDKDPALLFIGKCPLGNQTPDEGLYGLGAPGRGLFQTFCNFIGVDGGKFPDNLHDLKLGLRYLR